MGEKVSTSGLILTLKYGLDSFLFWTAFSLVVTVNQENLACSVGTKLNMLI